MSIFPARLISVILHLCFTWNSCLGFMMLLLVIRSGRSSVGVLWYTLPLIWSSAVASSTLFHDLKSLGSVCVRRAGGGRLVIVGARKRHTRVD